MNAFSLDEDRIAIRDMARAFADEKIAPYALEWDEKKHFPVDMIRETAPLGLGVIYVREDVGGSALTRFDAALIFEALARAFGKRLDEFQALQFRLADMATELEAARTLLWRAAAALDAKSPDATRLCAMAKRFATDAGFSVANDALQMFGGYGYLADYGVEKLVRDLRVHQILEGTNEIMRLIVARELVGRGLHG